MGKKFHVRIPNDLMNRKSSLKITPKELYLYYILHYNIRLSDYTNDGKKVMVTSLESLASFVTFQSRRSNNKQTIRELLLSMKTKGCIMFSDAEYKDHDLLDISIVEIPYEKGYADIDKTLFELASNEDEFAILCYIKKWENDPNYIMFEDEFSQILECGKSKRDKVLDGMEKNGVLIIDHGIFIPETGKRTPNKYKISGTMNKSENPIKPDVSSPSPNTPTSGDEDETRQKYTGEVDTEEYEKKWRNPTSRYEVPDFEFFEQLEDGELKSFIAKKIEKLLTTKASYFIQQSWDEAKRNVEQKRHLEELSKRPDEINQLKGTPVTFADGTFVEIDASNVFSYDWKSFYQKVDYIEYVSFVKEEYNSFRVAATFKLKGDLFGNGCLYDTETYETIIKSLQQNISQKKVEKEDLFNLERQLKRILAEKNKSRNYDEDWEGDYWEYYSTDDSGTNISKQKRIENFKREQRLEEEQHNRQEKEDYLKEMLSLWD